MSLPRSLQNEPLDGLLADDQIFSLVLGGPLYQLYLRTKLTRRPLDLLLRRVVGISLFCWLPLLLLSLFSRHIMGGVAVPFLYDVDVHTRFLAAVPLLIAAEVVVHGRIRPIVRQFIDRGIITQSDRPKFEAIINSTISLRNSVLIEVLILVFVYTVGHWMWREHFALGISTWYAFTVRWNSSHPRRILVCVRQSSHSPLHPLSVVLPAVPLVSLLVASPRTEFATQPVSP